MNGVGKETEGKKQTESWYLLVPTEELKLNVSAANREAPAGSTNGNYRQTGSQLNSGGAITIGGIVSPIGYDSFSQRDKTNPRVKTVSTHFLQLPGNSSFASS